MLLILAHLYSSSIPYDMDATLSFIHVGLEG